MKQFIIPIGVENPKRIQVAATFMFSIGETIRWREGDNDWVVEKIVTIIHSNERLVFVSTN